MSESRPCVLVTGISGNLGARLAPLLSDFDVIGVDFVPPASFSGRFVRMDLGEESSCRELVALLREKRVSAVVHLAFVIDEMRSGVLDRDRMWRINVGGTARVMEAVTEANRRGGTVQKFVFPSSVSAYGPDLPHAVSEDAPLRAHTLPYAVHKRESDQVVQARAGSLSECSTYLLRPHIFAAASVQNYLVGGFRGTPTGKGRVAAWLRRRGKRLPFVVPFGSRYMETRFQFIHIDDMARLITHILRSRETTPGALTILNVAGRGEALTLRRCLEIGNTRAFRVPGKRGARAALSLMWKWGICAVPPEATPYITGTYVMDTTRLRRFLGEEYETVIRYTIEQALADSFSRSVQQPATSLETTATR
jgi:UDP-glucose 4-epimerase